MSATASRTFAEERRAAIMDMLERTSSVQVADIAETFDVSSVTARADLDALASAGKLRRTHGGAVSLHKRLTVSVQDQRINVNVEAKQAIARSAIGLVRDGDTVFVDSGTTALEFVRMLDVRSGVTVITADITIADFIDESLPGVTVIMLGGELRQGHRYLFGPLTMAALGALHADLAVICPGAFVADRGFMTDFPQMAEIKTAAMGSPRAASPSWTPANSMHAAPTALPRSTPSTTSSSIKTKRAPFRTPSAHCPKAPDAPSLLLPTNSRDPRRLKTQRR